MDVIDPIEMDKFAQEEARRGQGGPVELQGQFHPARLPPEEGQPARETQAGEKHGQGQGQGHQESRARKREGETPGFKLLRRRPGALGAACSVPTAGVRCWADVTPFLKMGKPLFHDLAQGVTLFFFY